MNNINHKLCSDCHSRHGYGQILHSNIKEQIDERPVDYRDAVMEVLDISGEPDSRIGNIMRGFTCMWRDETHCLRMRTAREMTSTFAQIDDPQYNAALYLLSSSHSLFTKTIDCLRDNGLRLERIRLCSISGWDHTMYLAAYHIYNGDRCSLAERAVKYIVNDAELGLIINALIIARFGQAAFELCR